MLPEVPDISASSQHVTTHDIVAVPQGDPDCTTLFSRAETDQVYHTISSDLKHSRASKQLKAWRFTQLNSTITRASHTRVA